MYAENNICPTCMKVNNSITQQIHEMILSYKEKDIEDDQLNISNLKHEFKRLNDIYQVRINTLYVNSFISSLSITSMIFNTIKCNPKPQE